MKQKWFVATLIVQCIVGNNDTDARMCDEQVHLIRACDEDEAYTKALELGEEQRVSYENGFGETVTWDFVGLYNLELLYYRIEDGVEIRSKLFDSSDPQSLVSPKEKLSVFLALQNRQRVAAEKALAKKTKPVKAG